MKRKKPRLPRRPAGELIAEALALQEQGALAEAEQRYRELLRHEPLHHAAMNLLAMILLDRHDAAAALPLIARAITLAPDIAWYHLNLGHAYAAAGRDDRATAAMATSARLDPASPIPHYDLARHHLRHGRRDDALIALHEVLERDPAHARARFLIASLTGGHADTAPADYVTELFDSYAPGFEAHLVDVLGYQAPAQLAELVAAAGELPERAWRVIDVGCGSGLGGAAFRGVARHLIGSDLSPRMIEIARRRGVYDELHVEDLAATLRRAHGDTDLVVAADVFIYVGALDDAFGAAAGALRPGGLLAFSTERCDGDGFRLLPSSRYAHGDGYVRGLAERHGLAVRVTRDTVLRTDHTGPVAGVLYLLATASPSA
ncbi:MAG TPA: methyltransferase domain-containing protein [Kofleriaceae bacterium]|nr:methyltransferase domain-containing protein [Kofleriaceae bacterium]